MNTRTHSKREYTRILVLRTIGNFLILSSLFFIGKTFYQPLRAEFSFYWDRYHHIEYIAATKEEQRRLIQDNARDMVKGQLGRAFAQKNIQILVPADPQFGIIIPKIAANATIIPNVNTASHNEYLAALQKGVAHADGTAFPGEGGHIFLFAHSTDYFWNVGAYNAVFYLLYKLEPNDEVDLFYQGQRFKYHVTRSQIVDPSEVEYITRKTAEEEVTLQTCWPPGTTLKRLLVFASRDVK